MSSHAAELVVVGTGIQLGRHVSQRALSEFHAADRVLVLADAPTLHWLTGLRPDLINLAQCYGPERDRRQSYAQMVAMIMPPLRQGLRVCAVFYGHPGVFADVPHAAISAARAAGVAARMEPGVSAEACLYADLGIDPGRHGVQSLEATQFLVTQRAIEPSSLLLLWQVALSGSLDCIGFEVHPARIEVLVDKLRRWYPTDAEVILYEAAQMPLGTFRADHMTLADLPRAHYKEYTTLIIPPSRPAVVDEEFVRRLQLLA